MNVLDMILYNGKIIIFDFFQFEVFVIVIIDGLVIVVGGDEFFNSVMEKIKKIDFKRKRVILGLNDFYIYVICGGLYYNMELCWEGVLLFFIVLEMFKEQVRCIFVFQWVRVVGGWFEF